MNTVKIGNPLKQGLKPVRKGNKGYVGSGKNRKSIKTRIETFKSTIRRAIGNV